MDLRGVYHLPHGKRQMKKYKYIVVEAEDLVAFEKVVECMMNEGFRLHGSMIVNNECFYQSLYQVYTTSEFEHQAEHSKAPKLRKRKQ